MRINKDYEQGINIRDLFFDLVYHWRSILLAALIGTIVLGGLRYIDAAALLGRRGGSADRVNSEAYQQSLKSARDSVSDYAEMIAEQNAYLEESIYINLDFQSEWFASRTYYIRMDRPAQDGTLVSGADDPADAVAAVYVSMLTGGLDPAEMARVMGTDNRIYVDELVKLDADYQTNTMKLTIIGRDEDSVTEQLTFFAARMDAITGTAAQSVGPHTLVVVGEDTGVRLDTALADQKDVITKRITKWQTTLKEQKQALADLESEAAPEGSGRHLKRYAAIGFLLGACLMAAFHVLKYLLSDRLHTVRELRDRYELPVFGEFVRSRARRPGKGLDCLIERLEFGRAPMTAEAVRDGIATLLRERFEGRRVLLTGTAEEADILALRDELSRRLGDTCALTARGGLPGSTAAIAELKQADAVILVESKHVSRMGDIARAAELLQIAGADVQGCVVL